MFKYNVNNKFRIMRIKRDEFKQKIEGKTVKGDTTLVL